MRLRVWSCSCSASGARRLWAIAPLTTRIVVSPARFRSAYSAPEPNGGSTWIQQDRFEMSQPAAVGGGRAARSRLEHGEGEIGSRAGRVPIGVSLVCVEPRAVAVSEGKTFAADIELERAGRDGEKLDAACAVRLA
jgi:hypothetical protein